MQRLCIRHAAVAADIADVATEKEYSNRCLPFLWFVVVAAAACQPALTSDGVLMAGAQ